MEENMGKPVLAVAVHLGTTFSGVAYMQVGRNEMLWHLKKWPSYTEEVYKVPTIISYESRLGSWVPSAFGFAAKNAPASKRCESFTMHLDEESEEISSDPALTPTWVSLGKSAADVVKDFLELLYQHILVTLEGQGFSPNSTVYNIQFTIPPEFEWSEVQRFRSIIRMTGFGGHIVGFSLREPEAVILGTINQLGGQLKQESERECIVFCDAGNYTLDVSSYKISKLHTRVKIEQIEIISGGPHGSVKINRNFRNWFYKECLSEDWRAFFKSSPEARVHIHRICQRFIARMKVFDNSPSSPFITIDISPVNLTDPHIMSGFGMLRLSRLKMCEFFESSVAGTIENLKAHIQRCLQEGYSVNSILLVGDFGSSPYLISRVRQSMANLPGNIRIIQPVDVYVGYSNLLISLL
ncbi:hypothetical protein ABW19_dt0200372 [Dactylella cylindrospora]|nr:hypothetical protein ABW19_dt0200372 [Dactylella cylindrospora]